MTSGGVGGTSHAARVVVGYPKSEILELSSQQPDGARNHEACVHELQQQNLPAFHQALISVAGDRTLSSRESTSENPNSGELDRAGRNVTNGVCILAALSRFWFASVSVSHRGDRNNRYSNGTEGNGQLFPLDWVQAPGTKSSEIQRKLLPGETLSQPNCPLAELELLDNQIRQPRHQLGDRGIVRLFFQEHQDSTEEDDRRIGGKTSSG